MNNSQFGILFPGQGSQSVGMLQGLAATYPMIRQTYEEASETLHLDLWKLVQEGPAEQLNQTRHTQPAMLAAGVAVWRLWRTQDGATPSVMAGHSLGEYSALVCADVLAFSDAVGLVAERGRLMQAAVPEGSGGMAAILGLDDARVRELCSQAAASEVVAAVNYNSPGQVVIAGHKAAVERACELAKAAGAKRALPLPVSVPSHCALMKPAADRLQARLAEISMQTPTIPIYHNVNVEPAGEAESIRSRLAEQLYSPVRWVETIQAISARGVHTLLEAGPGKVLTGLNKRIDKQLHSLAVFSPESLASALEKLQ